MSPPVSRCWSVWGGCCTCAGCPLGVVAALVLGLPAVGFAVAAVTAADPAAALPGLVRYLQVFVLVPAAVYLLLRDVHGFRIVAGALVVLAAVQGVVGVHQYVTGTGASYMGEEVRAVGTFGPSDIMGMATVVAYGLLAAAACALRTPRNAPAWLRPCAAVVAVALIVPLALSFSRGVWIATAAAFLVVLALTGRRQALTSLAVLGASAVVLVGGFGIGSEMIAERAASVTQVTRAPDRSVSDRYAMWSAAGGMWREQPLTGVGLKGFPAHRDAHASIGLSSGSDTAGAGQAFHAAGTALTAQHVSARPQRAGPHRSDSDRRELGGDPARRRTCGWYGPARAAMRPSTAGWWRSP